MHETLRESLDPVLRDLRSTGGPVPRVSDSDWIGHPSMASAMVHGHGFESTGISVLLLASKAEQVASIADQVQEWAIEQLWGGASTNWPPCPLHPTTHPLMASVVDNVATWVCPRDATAIAPIGELC